MIRRPVASTAGNAPPPPLRHPPRAPQPRWGRALWGALFVGVVATVLYLTWSLFSVLFASAVLAYLLDPLVTRLAARGYSRDAAIGVLTAVGLALATTAALVLVPGIVQQFAELSRNLVPYLQGAAARGGPLVAQAEARFGIDIPLDFDELATNAPAYLELLSPDMRTKIQGLVTSIGAGSLQVVLSVLSVSLLPVFTFYLLRDWPRILVGVDDLVPPRHRLLVGRLALEIDARIGAWLRGQLLVAALLGCFYTVGLLISGIDLAFTMGLLSGALFLLPYIGPIGAGTVSTVLALLKFGVDWHVAVVLGTYGLGQVLEGTFLTPALVGDRVGLHPMVVIVALIVAGNLLGIWGLILALPVTAALDVLLAQVLLWYRQSRTYRG